MNRRQLRYGGRVAYLSSKYATARRATVKHIDNSDGYDAMHTLTLVDDDWKPLLNSNGDAQTIRCSSRKIKAWEEVEEGIEEKRFQQARQEIQNKLNQEAAAKQAEPWERLRSLLALNGLDESQVQVNAGYGTPARNYNIVVMAPAFDDFLELLLPFLTQRLFERTPVLPVVDDS